MSAYRQFLSLINDKNSFKLKIVANSIADHFKEWMTYISSSVKLASRNEEKLVLFKEFPNNVQNKITTQQALLVSKFFRPDCLLRYAQYYIRRCFKSNRSLSIYTLNLTITSFSLFPLSSGDEEHSQDFNGHAREFSMVPSSDNALLQLNGEEHN